MDLEGAQQEVGVYRQRYEEVCQEQNEVANQVESLEEQMKKKEMEAQSFKERLRRR